MLVRAGARLGVAGLFLLGAHNALQTADAEGDTRTISFHHLHTDEAITITYKRNGRYDDEALKKLDWFMRDWRKEQSISMDPHLYDLIWEANREVGGMQAIQVVCGYRSPETNSMLRQRSSGVAQFSQHTQGHAMDFFIPDVPLEKIRYIGLRMQRGGVGFYPTSGSPFVHLDTGSVRHWPRMTHDQLVKVFPDGRTVHVPSDGVPLPGYALALADVERRGGSASGTSMEAAREAGVTVASIDKPQRTLLDRLFGRVQQDEDEQSEQPAPKQPRFAVASLGPGSLGVGNLTVPTVTPPSKKVATETFVPPMPHARPQQTVVASIAPAALPKPRPAQPTFATASASSTSVFDNRGYWRGAIDPNEKPKTAQTPFEVASAGPVTTGSGGNRDVMAYAPESQASFESQAPLAPARARPMGAKTAALTPAPANATLAGKQALATMMSGSQRADSPWMRAALLTPSVHNMTAHLIGPNDPRPLQDMMQKPSMSVAMTFSADPHLGMVTESFSGNAVVFLATQAFSTQTAALK